MWRRRLLNGIGTAALGVLVACGPATETRNASKAPAFLTALNLNHSPTVPVEHLPLSEIVLLQGVSDTAWPVIQAAYSNQGYATCWRSPAETGPGPSESADPGRLAVVARPALSPNAHNGLTFRIEGKEYAPSHAPVEVLYTNHTGHVFRLWNLHMHSKAWHPSGQHEVRRNEARLAWQEVRKQAKAHPEETVLVAATMNDDPGSASVAYFTNASIPDMEDLRPVHDGDRSAWTHHRPEEDHWVRHDYLFIRDGSPPTPEKQIGSAHLGDPPSAQTRRPLHLP